MFFVRTATQRDLPAISDLLRETWHATYDAIYGRERVAEITTAWHGTETLRPWIGRRDAEFLVADDGSRLGGMAFAAYGTDRAMADLHQLYVRSDCQRAGVGSDLLAEIAGAFPEAGRLRAQVEDANAPALAFYRKAGFVAVGPADRPEDPFAGHASTVMDKPIG